MATDEGVQYETRTESVSDAPPVHVVCHDPTCTFEFLCDGWGYLDDVFEGLPVTAPEFQAVDLVMRHQNECLEVENRLHNVSMEAI